MDILSRFEHGFRELLRTLNHGPLLSLERHIEKVTNKSVRNLLAPKPIDRPQNLLQIIFRESTPHSHAVDEYRQVAVTHMPVTLKTDFLQPTPLAPVSIPKRLKGTLVGPVMHGGL